MRFLHKLERSLPEQSITVIKRVDRPARLLTHDLIVCRLISRGLSTDFVACNFVTGIVWFGGLCCD